MQRKYARRGGTVALNARYYKGGQFLPHYVPRCNMPQVDDVDALLEYLGQLGVCTVKTCASPNELVPFQRIDWAHAAQIPDRILKLPLLVSKDGGILDGNHRWAGNKLRGSNVPVVKIDACFNDALEMLRSFPETYYNSPTTFGTPPA